VLKRAGGEQRQRHLATPAPRLADQPVTPLEVQPPHPQRCARHRSRQVVEHAADADTDRDAEGDEVAVEPVLLFGRAIRDQQHVDASGGGDHRSHGLVVCHQRRTWHGASDLEAGKIALQDARRAFGDVAPATEQEPPFGTFRRLRRELEHEVCALDVLSQPITS